MPRNDLALLIEAARRAGEIAAPMQSGGDLGVSYKQEDGSPVTRADLAVNDMLEHELRSARPDYGWLSEESTANPSRLSAARSFVIDPIDGTRTYIEGGKSWSHALAVVEGSEVIAAVVYLPKMACLYSASAGGGALLNGQRITVGARTAPEGADALATKPSMEPRFWPGGVPGLRPHHRPSLAYRLCLVAQGRFDAMITFRPSWEWDIAAGALIASEAGARVTDTSGASLRFNQPHPQSDGVLSANPALHDALLQRMTLT